jgi:alkylhydroperoxidase family enzyme
MNPTTDAPVQRSDLEKPEMEVLRMSWVRHADDAAGLPHILASHSLNGEALRARVALYRTIMFGPSELSRSEREAIAVRVSSVNGCHY